MLLVVVAGSGAAAVPMDSKPAMRVFVSRLALMPSLSMAGTSVEQVGGRRHVWLVDAYLLCGPGWQALTDPGLTVETIPDCADEPTASTTPAPGLKPNVEPLAGTAWSGLLL
jgi:hypothetical protein